ncbi:hypothetical protein [Priestia aryabhattai]|uniref:hypothetical protein n=1 Tax=Priestia aryabhattai TaxID=412384 RepID=UPI00064EAA3E|nr:hypothetical protein [Priestia aryabhattai]KML27784.1 hypothetical protein VL11_17625 [Priestia aryabhattai]KMO01939.1 hypothetical protein ABV89_00240 [Priestia aryabhattai]
MPTTDEIYYAKILDRLGSDFIRISNSIPTVSKDTNDIATLKSAQIEFERCIKEYDALKSTMSKVPMGTIYHLINEHKELVNAIDGFVTSTQKMHDSISTDLSSIDYNLFEEGEREQKATVHKIEIVTNKLARKII